MDIHLSNGDKIRGDMIVSAVVRSDLVPVPVTLECTVRFDDTLAKHLASGQMVTLGEVGSALRIVWSSSGQGQSGVQQGDRPLGQISFVALLDSCADVAFRRSKAVIKEGATLGAIYRACGAKVSIESDFTVERFSCFAGGVPSYHIAVALQEEAGALVWSSSEKKLRFKRLPDLFSGSPTDALDASGVDRQSSGFMERHEIPWFYSTDRNGAVVHGNRTKARGAVFTPLKHEGTLKNMSRALVHHGTFTGRLFMRLNAGDLVSVDGQKLVVVTAAHALEAGDSNGVQNTYSRFWLSTLEG